MDSDSDSDADSLDLLEFAQVAFPRIIDIAMRLGVEKVNSFYAALGAQLCCLNETLASPTSPDQEEVFRRRMPKLLKKLEMVCTWAIRPVNDRYDQYRALRTLAGVRETSSFREAESTVRRGLEAFASEHSSRVNQLIDLIQNFSKQKASRTLKRTPDGPWTSTKKPVELPFDYPDHINNLSYTVLQNHQTCTCGTSGAPTKHHLARLRLRASQDPPYIGTVQFDLIFSASPAPPSNSRVVQWQDVQLIVPARFSDKQRPSCSALKGCEVVRSGQFCRLISGRLGSTVRMKVQGETLTILEACKPIENILDTPSVSLTTALETRHLTAKMKVALAYTLARSVWQYYDSDWMKTKWTGENIHFMQEPVPGLDEDSALYANKPYFCVRFDEAGSEAPESSHTYGIIHRYPRVLALGIMLIEIGLGHPLKIDRQSPQWTINSDWTMASKISDEENPWPNFDYSRYRTAVKACLDRDVFSSADSLPGQSKEEYQNGLEERRIILYRSVVYPLEELLTGTGWSNELTKIGPMEMEKDSANTQARAQSIIDLSSQNQRLVNLESKKAAEWLRNVAKINASLARSQKSCQPPIRVAILDTGYDDEAVFFHPPSRSNRLKEWKDWVDDSPTPEDCNGHGTHVVSLVMKTAPTADIYVARVAKDTAGLHGAADRIADAIEWAVKEWKVDIISLSFGFPMEVPSISQAIRWAVYERHDAILFFAAAANYGANEKEMFPAFHDSVISIRGTNSAGVFADFNPPRNLDEGVVFGTLGKDVPSAGLRSSEDEVCKSGTSVATPIAAGIAAMILRDLDWRSDQHGYRLAREKLRTRRGMRAIFKALATPTGDPGCYYLAPWKYFREDDSARWGILQAALSSM
ncbi:MAG: hypothetical protein M1819_003534 [Sarea resinae]|nr:MAG: hypothetical protein M1819_003534 [Sarea resinae]